MEAVQVLRGALKRKKIGFSFMLLSLFITIYGCSGQGDLSDIFYVAAGRVVDVEGNGVEGIRISFSGNYVSVVTDAEGRWRKENLKKTVTVTPVQEHVLFQPANKSLSGETHDLLFTAVFPSLEGVETLEAITASYGTAFSNLGLPEQLDAVLNNGAVVRVNVVWDASTYPRTGLGSYLITGELCLPPFYHNPEELAAEVEVNLTPIGIIRVDPIQERMVRYGTSRDELELPEQVTVILADYTTSTVSVLWNEGHPIYEATAPGWYTFSGELILHEYMENGEGLEASLQVRVLLGITHVPPVEDILAPFGTPYEALGLPLVVSVALDDDSITQLEAVWDRGQPFYDGNSVGRFSFHGELVYGENMYNPQGITAHMVVNIPSYMISGTVRKNEVGLEGVTITFSNGFDPVVTASEGGWVKEDLGGAVTVIPVKDGYSFSPESIFVDGSCEGVDFVASSMKAVVSVTTFQFGPSKIFRVTVHSVESVDDGEGFTILYETNDILPFGQEMGRNTLEDEMPLFIFDGEGQVLAQALLAFQDLQEEAVELFPAGND